MASVARQTASPVSHADIHAHRILILDFGAQYTQLIARRVRELGVYCEIHPWDISDDEVRGFKPRGVILSGGPESVTDAQPPKAVICPRYSIIHVSFIESIRQAGKLGASPDYHHRSAGLLPRRYLNESTGIRVLRRAQDRSTPPHRK